MGDRKTHCYLLTFPDGKKYVGASYQPKARRKLHTARLGFELADVELALLSTHKTQALALKAERRWIEKLDTLSAGYNGTGGGGGEQTDAQRAAMKSQEYRTLQSTIQKARFADPAERAKLSAGQQQRFLDPKERAKVGERTRNRFKDPTYHKRLCEIMGDVNRSLSKRKANSDGVRKKWADPVWREKMLAARRVAREARKMEA